MTPSILEKDKVGHSSPTSIIQDKKNNIPPREKEVQFPRMLNIKLLYFSILLSLMVAITLVSASINTATRPLRFRNVSFDDIQRSRNTANAAESSILQNVVQRYMRGIYQNEIAQDDQIDQDTSGLPRSNSRLEHNLAELVKRLPANANSTAINDPIMPLNTQGPTSVPTMSSSESMNLSPSTSTSSPTSEVMSQMPQQSSDAPHLGGNTSGSAELTSISPTSKPSQAATTNSRSTSESLSQGISATSTKSVNTPSSVKHPITRQTIYTTTFPDGVVSTLTSTTVVPAESDPSENTSASKTRPAPGLQTNVAHSLKSVKLRGTFGVMILLVYAF
ncbi:putative Blumeria-specific protein [Blumeria hordei DH14]|uniref:Putative Blumeria-specific protein n=1 Tax=Blumeria graminis f. sp. hordei (strain DH14) TaxID=546991 RepID=N1JCF6_BLUG1|nr:putative Blumeria-specific protein [Blumeria hordei DH14]